MSGPDSEPEVVDWERRDQAVRDGRAIEIGSFLNEDERRQLAKQLSRDLRHL